MVLCRFFQQGSCRYGTKCHNEHFDVKVYLKVDMESAINGKMWPFSAYGPFKDKVNFPNFIEDQSFEEVRFMCYEAKRQNNFEHFHQQFNREVQEATNKMKTMLQMPPQVLDTLIKIYESPEGTSVTSAPQQTNNPFAAAPAAQNASTSLFGKPTLTTGNIFGAATSQVNNAGSIFAGSMSTVNTGTSIFGGPAVAAPTPNVFGQPQQQQQPTQTSGQAFQGGNIFGQAPVQAQTQPVNPNPFGGYPAAGGIFGQAANPNSGGLFGQAAQQQQQQPQQPPAGLFSQAAGFSNQQQQLQQQQLQMQQQQQQQQQQQLMMQQQQMLQQQEQQQLQQQVANATPSLAYSKMDELTADEIEAFKSDQFLPGHLPSKPPPREFC